MSVVYIIYGVSGSGKTTIGKKLANELYLPFYDADDFHPKKNIEKMSAGVPLTDQDRIPWLRDLASNIQNWKKNKGAVLACSALKQKYRDILSSSSSKIQWVFLDGTYNQILSRMTQRDHFMPEKLLRSQFNTLEKPDHGLIIDINLDPNEIVHSIISYYNTHE